MDPRVMSAGAFAPLRHRAFAVLWFATLVSNTGTWFRDVANGWSMTEMAPSPVMVALVQAAATLPVFLLSLPAGALADLVDRRRLLIVIQLALAGVTLALAVASMAGAMTPGLLLALTFAAGVGAALMGPAWQAVVPELVPRPVLRQAIALNSLGINIARAIGPAIGGAVVASFGVVLAYWLDAASYALILVALVWWQRQVPASTLPPERFGPAMATGLRYVVASPDLRRVLLRAALFFISGPAYWALLPLFARQTLGGDAALYGLMLTAIGTGAVTGALLLPRLGGKVSSDRIVLAGSLATAAAMAALALAPVAGVALAALFVAGLAWIAVLTTLNVSAQTVLPNWVRARGLAVYITVFYGAMTAGSILWGQIAQHLSIPASLLVAAAACAGLGLAAMAVPLPEGEADLTPSMHWPEPAVAAEIDADRGPVMVCITYEVDPAERAAFLAALAGLAAERRRDGGYGWMVYEDAAEPRRIAEVFHVASWLDHLRQHQRVTHADAEVQAAVLAFHRGDEPPRVEHWIGTRSDR